MFVQTAGSEFVLKCKDCHRLVTNSETNAYRLIAGVLYGWCDECFNDRHKISRLSSHEHTPGPKQRSVG
jgi:hypothetical protein